MHLPPSVRSIVSLSAPLAGLEPATNRLEVGDSIL